MSPQSTDFPTAYFLTACHGASEAIEHARARVAPFERHDYVDLVLDKLEAALGWLSEAEHTQSHREPRPPRECGRCDIATETR